MAGGEREKLRLSAAAPRRQRHQRGSASDPQALESHRSTGPWRHQGWGPLLQGTGPAAGGSERRARPVRRLLSAPAGAAVWAAAGQGLRGAWPWEHREEAGDKIPEGPVRGVGRSRRLPLRAGRPGCGWRGKAVPGEHEGLSCGPGEAETPTSRTDGAVPAPLCLTRCPLALWVAPPPRGTPRIHRRAPRSSPLA